LVYNLQSYDNIQDGNSGFSDETPNESDQKMCLNLCSFSVLLIFIHHEQQFIKLFFFFSQHGNTFIRRMVLMSPKLNFPNEARMSPLGAFNICNSWRHNQANDSKQSEGGKPLMAKFSAFLFQSSTKNFHLEVFVCLFDRLNSAEILLIIVFIAVLISNFQPSSEKQQKRARFNRFSSFCLDHRRINSHHR
jgi:hypothetical protein